MSYLLILQIVGCVLAWLGSWLCGSLATSQRRRGFWFYFVANGALAVWAGFDHAWPLMLLYLAFVAPAVRGIRNNRTEPRPVG